MAQELNPATLRNLKSDSWPTYNGDYSGRRHSPLKQINASNVNSLETAWTYRATDYGAASFGSVLKSTPLMVNGVLYFTMPENVWAVDARTGREIWHYKAQPTPGFHIGHRGVAMWGDWLYFETPDCNLLSLNAKDGKPRWSRPIADPKLEYFCTMAPLVVGNHIVAGVGGDSLDNPGYLQSLDPETGALQWQWNTEPKVGEPGSESWPDAESMGHGGGMTWMTGTYDPELNLTIGAPAIQIPCMRELGAKATICGLVRLWLSIQTRVSWLGITRSRRMTRTIGMRCRRPC